MKFFSIVAVFLTFSITSFADETEIIKHIEDISVVIKAGDSYGTGVVKTRDNINYIWTAAHVIDDQKIEKDGKITGFQDVKILQSIKNNKKEIVGQLTLDCEVLRFSCMEKGHDLALLRVKKENAFKDSVVFCKDDFPRKGSALFHIGTFRGPFGESSLTDGIISQHGRVINDFVFDQCSTPVFPGSSGGGVFLKNNGECVGLVLKRGGETFGLYCPTRRMKSWAKDVGVEFAIDDNIPIPTEKKLKEFIEKD